MTFNDIVCWISNIMTSSTADELLINKMAIWCMKLIMLFCNIFIISIKSVLRCSKFASFCFNTKGTISNHANSISIRPSEVVSIFFVVRSLLGVVSNVVVLSILFATINENLYAILHWFTM